MIQLKAGLKCKNTETTNHENLDKNSQEIIRRQKVSKRVKSVIRVRKTPFFISKVFVYEPETHRSGRSPVSIMTPT